MQSDPDQHPLELLQVVQQSQGLLCQQGRRLAMGDAAWNHFYFRKNPSTFDANKTTFTSINCSNKFVVIHILAEENNNGRAFVVANSNHGLV